MTQPSTSRNDDRSARGGEDAVETAMGTGSDEGAPGEHRSGPPLDAAESALLHNLQQGDDGEPTAAVEDSPAMTAAAEDDAVLPAASGQTRDATDGAPAFVEPDGS